MCSKKCVSTTGWLLPSVWMLFIFSCCAACSAFQTAVSSDRDRGRYDY